MLKMRGAMTNSFNSLMDGGGFFTAGAGLIGLTAGLAVLRTGAVHAYSILQRRLFVSLEIVSKDPGYRWFLYWMANQPKQQSKTLFDRFLNREHHQLALNTTYMRHSNGSSEAFFSLVPGPGTHFFQYKNKWFKVDRQRNQVMGSDVPFETLTITTLQRDRKLFDDMLSASKQAALAQEEGKTVIYTSYGPDWREFGKPRKRRPIESVVLDENKSQEILDDVHKFLGGGKWYHDRGIPYRRGYMLYGPPGSGKSSYIQALAGELGYNIAILNLAEPHMTDDRLSHLLNNVPYRTLMLLEDVDAAFPDRTDKKTNLTFSGLLNALDGVAASEERIIFMTTNHVERLDPALIRPGRVDMQVYVGNVTESQAKKMFLRFYPDQVDLADQFVKNLRDNHCFGKTSPAQLQGHFVFFRDDAYSAAHEIHSLMR
ncbi:BCS1 N terminal-domain-containing protein [Gorgonomyces haynaldii]|nr:BCS1 N terminal-domain-containing protein [Gorgonomyces haynaldii]